MKKLIFLSIFLIQFSVIFAQIVVKIKPNKEIKLDGRNFYISKVIDNRGNKDKEIGRIGKENKEKILELENNLEPYFLYFLSITYPKTDKTSLPVTLIVNSIECEKDTKLLKENVKITMEVQVISSENSSSMFDYKVSNSIERITSDGRTYGKLLEKDLTDTFDEFNKSLKKGTN